MSQAKAPPFSLDAEQSLLGGLILRNESWFEIAGRIVADDFYQEGHRIIFAAMAEVMSANQPLDLVTLNNHLKQSEKLEAAGGFTYLGHLANDTPSGANVLAYAEIVRTHAVLRGLISVGQDIAELGFRPEGKPQDELIDLAEQKVFGIREKGARGNSEFFEIGDLMDGVETRVDMLRNNPSALAGLPSGFIDLDRKTNGMHPGDLIIVAGRPGMGKTSFAMNIAEHVAMVEKKAVGVFSMEMGADQLALRVLSSFGRIDQSRLRSGELDDHDWDKLVSAGAIIRDAPLLIDETGALNPFDLRARARRMARRHDIKLLVVDYIQLMTGTNSRENRTNEISEISRSLKALAKELKVPIIALSQLSREVEKRENKRPLMSDLRESGSIEQDADLVLFIYRPSYYMRKEGQETSMEDDNTAEVILAKHRSGPTGMVKTAFQGRFTRFDNLDRHDYG